MPRLDDYHLVRELARGGMGVVHEAIERATGRRVALKRILAGALDADALARFLVEGRALARLDHPAIVRVHALEQAPGGPFMVMDLVPGESLQRALDREGPLAPERALAVARALAGALEHAHAHGVLHRDLKPANVLVDEQGDVRLIDFGLARLQVDGGSLAHLTRTGEVLGTPAFMAPEQADGRPVDARTDVYGLGATLHTLLTARPPFSGTSAIAVLDAVLTRAPTPPSRLRPGLPRALDDIVLACLAKDPARRPANMATVRARLEAAASGRGPSRGWPWIAAAALAALAGVGALAVASRRSTAPVVDQPVSAAPPTSSSTAAADTVRLALEAALGEREAEAARRPDDVDAWLELARARVRLGDVAGALAPPPDDAPAAAWLAHGLALLAAERFDDALAALAHEGLDPADRRVVLARFEARAAASRVLGTPAEAVLDDPDAARLFGAIADAPGWAEGVFAREWFLLSANEDVEVARAAATELRRLGAEALAGRLAAEAASGARDLVGALARIDAALAADPSSARAHLERAMVLVRQARHGEAELAVTRALELDPLLTAAWRLRSNLRSRARRHRDASADATRQVELLGPASWSRYTALAPALLLRDGGLLPEALAALEALRAVRVTAELELELGRTLEAMGDAAGARAAFERVLVDRPPGRVTDYIAAADALGPTTRWEEPFLAYLRSVDDVGVWIASANLLRQLGHRAAARVVAEGAVAQRGGGAAALAIRARTRADDGRLEDALEDWDEVVRLLAGTTSTGTLAGDPGWRLTRHTALVARSELRRRVGDARGALQDAIAAGQALPAGHPRERSVGQAVAQLEAELRALEALRAAAVATLEGRAREALPPLLASKAHAPDGPHVRLLFARVARLIARAGVDRDQMLNIARSFVKDAADRDAPVDEVQDLRRRLAEDPYELSLAEAADPQERARGLMGLGRYAAAAELLRSLTASTPRPELVLALATCLRVTGDPAGAATCYERVIGAEGPFGLVARRALAAQQNEAGDGAAALRWLDDPATAGPLPPNVAAGLEGERARALLHVDRAGDALAAAERAAARVDEALRTLPRANRDALGGERARAIATRGQALLRLGRPGEGRTALLEALRTATSLPLEEQHVAKRDVRERALAALPDDPEVLRWADRAFP